MDFKGTDLLPEASGKAKVNSKAGRLQINADFSHLPPATKFGAQYLTYVLWAITPEGRPVNLGEVVPKDGKAGIEVTTDLQAFGLILTAEPYFAVTRPSNLVVAENVVLQKTEGLELPIDAKFDMLEGGQYTIDVPADQLPATTSDPNTQLDLLEARNAVAIAKAAGAEQYAADSLSKAQSLLAQAEDYLRRKQGRTPIGSVSRGATEAAEDARVLTLRRKEEERVAAEKRRTQESRRRRKPMPRPPPPPKLRPKLSPRKTPANGRRRRLIARPPNRLRPKRRKTRQRRKRHRRRLWLSSRKRKRQPSNRQWRQRSDSPERGNARPLARSTESSARN